MKLKIFCRCSLFPSWSGYWVISTPVSSCSMLAVFNAQIPAVIIFTNFFIIKILWISAPHVVAKCWFSSKSQQSVMCQGLLFIKRSQSHSGTPHSVGLPWRSNQPDAWVSTWQQTTLTRDRHPCPWRDSNPLSQPSERPQTPHLRSRGHGTTVGHNTRRNFNWALCCV